MIKPLGARIIVDPIDHLNRTPSGVIIPDAHLPKPVRGRVLAVGEGQHTTAGVLVPVNLKEGDVVLFGKHSGSLVDIDGQKVLFLMEQEIFGVDHDYVEPEKVEPIVEHSADLH